MEITTTASALPSKGAWGSFASRILDGISAVREHYQQQRMVLAAGELDHPGVWADIEAAVRRHDDAKMRAIFEGYAVSIPEWKRHRC
jgi:hypothetical protein